MAHQLQTKTGREPHGQWKYTVETVFGIVKQVLGYCQFSRRGLDKVTGAWKRVMMAYNLKRRHILAG